MTGSTSLLLAFGIALALSGNAALAQSDDGAPPVDQSVDERVDLDLDAFNDALFARLRATVAPDFPGPTGAPLGERRVCPPVPGLGVPTNTTGIPQPGAVPFC